MAEQAAPATSQTNKQEQEQELLLSASQPAAART